MRQLVCSYPQPFIWQGLPVSQFVHCFQRRPCKMDRLCKRSLSKPGCKLYHRKSCLSVQIQRAVQQIYPRYAESFVAQYQTAVNNIKAWQYLLNGSLYLPGLSSNHNLVLTPHTRREILFKIIFSLILSLFPGAIMMSISKDVKAGG
jgi:hypothetical protein